MHNRGTIRADRMGEFSWGHFDALPRELKELAWYGPIFAVPSEEFSHLTIAQRRERLARIVAKQTAELYGPDHPQADAQ